MYPANYNWNSTVREIAVVEQEEGSFNMQRTAHQKAVMDNAKKFVVRVGCGAAFLILIVWPLLALPAGT